MGPTGLVHVPFYATGFRGDGLAAELSDIAAISLRYGATEYRVYRYREDRYKFLLEVVFAEKLDWDRYWEGPEAIHFRAKCSGWYQVPILYGWADLIASGELPANGNGGNGGDALEPVASGGGSSSESA